MDNRLKRFLELIVLVFIAAAFFGCAAQNTNINSPSGAGAQSEAVYQPKAPPGMQSSDAAIADLSEILGSEQRLVGITFGSGRYYSELDLNLYTNVNELAKLYMGGTGGVRRDYDSNRRLIYFLFKSMTVLEDRIQICPGIPLYYADLMYGPIYVKTSNHNYPYLYTIQIRDQILFHFHKGDLAGAQRFADDLFSIQQSLKKQNDERLAIFESKAAEYRTLTIKPPVSEEQRRLIVQANALNQRKDYGGAIGLYLKAVDLDPVSYPGAYFNLALLSAQLKWYNKAIGYMKQYLMLVPDAKDARSAQDKIYEWEMLMQK